MTACYKYRDFAKLKYLNSDWAILNDTSSKQLQRVFSQFHHLTNLEIQQATRDRVINEALAYTDPEHLQALNEQIEEALDEQVTQVMQEAAKEASTANSTKNQTTATSLFAERLCHHLHLSGFMS